ncbi:external alternative NAD(P)H-ubiquinone oxidoreductase B1, mitochondrial-like [Xenia sp. Carnegie-2017]|uniref:external alternative NAD(P)H-ubiquinone oxidoreductase B1, mitochondrial-like n=1 Tax=Xenia sp. Carnegie-2017 TaxID=2897299 RepID=UPI001F03A427|nr:external alternative NAD(P)H-ubiquinone oxidoreductase B1, mitochondrial-like [Xenia sp. Carnegie-2017]
MTPLLPSVTVGTLEARSLVEPIRKLYSKWHKTDIYFHEAECVDVDVENHVVKCQDISGIAGENPEFTLNYDLLIVAVGAQNNTFNTPGVEENCHFLKSINDVNAIRNNILDCFETAAMKGRSDDEIKQLLHFVVVGGGPTGVEFAAELCDFVKEDLIKQYGKLSEIAQITLVHSRDHILNNYDEQISDYTEKRFKSDIVNCVTNSRVTEVIDHSLVIMDKMSKQKRNERFGVCVWATGIAPCPLTKKIAQKLPQQNNRHGLVTDKFLRVKGSNGTIYAIGDCAVVEQEKITESIDEWFKKADKDFDGSLDIDEFTAIMEQAKEKYPQVSSYFTSAWKTSIKKAFNEVDEDGNKKLNVNEFRDVLKKVDSKLRSYPATAQVASQQGRYLAKLFTKIHSSENEDFKDLDLQPFSYRHLGSFAYVGDDKAVLKVPILGTLSGWWVMWLWRATYLNECVGWRTRILVAFDWIKTKINGRDTSRI